jgi:ribulose-phosphate 3-epimerase
MSVKIAPSILAADLAALADDVARVRPEADLLHVDIMDGHFVPNLTIGPPVVKALRAHTDLFLDCHLMVGNPEWMLEPLAEAGANGVTVHIELGDPTPLLERIRDLGMGPGLTLNPPTPFEAVEPYLERIDLLLVMSVNPGFGGQSFIGEVLTKVERARWLVEHRSLDVDIQIDGGIRPETGRLAAAAGANVLVAGSGIFLQPDPVGAAREIRLAAEEAVEAAR